MAKETPLSISSEIIFDSGQNRIRQDTVTFPDGQKEIHEILLSPQGVLILPITQDGKLILITEFRHNHGWVYGIPMGKKEATDLTPLDAARRELQEETGLSATSLTPISSHDNGVHEEGLNYFYLAEGLVRRHNQPDKDEDIGDKIIDVSFEDAFKLIGEGKIVDLPSRACIWAGYIHLLHRDKGTTDSEKPH